MRIQKHRGQKDGSARAPRFFAEICICGFIILICFVDDNALMEESGDGLHNREGPNSGRYTRRMSNHSPRKLTNTLFENCDCDGWPHFIIQGGFYYWLAFEVVVKASGT